MASCEKKYTILLLSAPIGSGHKLAAQALEQSFALADNVQVVHGSIFDFFPGSIGNAFLRFYLWVLSYCPWLYELAYKWGNRQSGSLWLRNFINGTLASLAQDFIVRTNPDAVIATHATPAGIMAIYKKKFKPDLLLCILQHQKICVHSLMGLMLRFYRREYRFGGNFTRHMIVRSCVVNLIGLSRI